MISHEPTSNLRLDEEIKMIVLANSTINQDPELGTVTKLQGDRVQVTLDTGGILNNLKVLGSARLGSRVLVSYPYESNPIALVENDTITQTILALGLGLFKIREDGVLYVELPVNVENFFEIKEDGVLYVTLPKGASNDYHLGDDGILYYNREEF